jgi:hypothetical protein
VLRTSPMTESRCKGRGGIRGTRPQILVRRGGVTATQEQKSDGHQESESAEKVTRTKKKKKKIQRSEKKKATKNHKMSPSGIDLAGFPEGPRARPLDHRRSLIRSTYWNSVRQSSYLPSALKIVLDVLTIFSVLQIVLLYYPRSTVPRCAQLH